MCDKLVGFDIFFTNNTLSHFFNLFLAVDLCIIAFRGATCRFLSRCSFLSGFCFVYEVTPKWGLSLQGAGEGQGSGGSDSCKVVGGVARSRGGSCKM